MIIHGDCLDILKTIPDRSIDLVLTDPPYIHKHMDGGGFASASKFYAGGKIDFISDFDFDKYIPEISKKTNKMVCFHSRDLISNYSNFAKLNSWGYDLHVWHKTNAIPFCHNTWKSDLEYISVFWNGNKKMINGLPQKEYSKIFISSLMNPTNKQHPAEKPVKLMEKYISVMSQQNDTILDPFAGSGTTGVACLNLNRKFILIEKEEKYIDIINKRLAEAQSLLDYKARQGTLWR